jgi:DegV family protein with EDD domain
VTKTAVMTDSAAALPDELRRALGVSVVPLELVVDGVARHDGEVPVAELVAHIGEGVSTSSPPPGRIADAMRSCRRDADAVLMLTVAERMSTTYEAACLAAKTVDDAVHVLDTETAAGAEALVVAHAARCARRGDGIGTVEQEAKTVIDRVRLVATLDSLDDLVRSGRVPELAGRAGRLLNVHPLFEFRRGGVHALRPALSSDAAVDRIVGLWQRTERAGGRLHVAALHANDPERAARLLERVSERVEPATAFVAEFSAVMLAHTGPGLAGLAWWWEPD